MINTCVYTGIMLTILFVIFVTKRNLMGKILWMLYTFVGVVSVVAVQKGLLQMEVTLFPYLFLIVIYLIVFFPYLDKSINFNVEKLTSKINVKYLIFIYIFIFTGIITIIYYIPLVKQLIISGEWIQNRNDLYSGTFRFTYTWYQYFALQFVGYTKLLGMIVGFVILRSGEKSMLGLTAILVGCISSILSAMYQSSRGAIVNIILLTFVMVLFFYKELSNNKKRFVVICLLVGIVLIIPYVIDVTISRFSSEGAFDSLLSYFGQPPIVFNYGVTPINKYLFGTYALGNLFGMKPISPSDIGGLWGSSFYSFVGWLFIDWGYIGTLLVSLLISFITYLIIIKKKYDIADVFLLFFIYYTLLQGVFVIGQDYCYNIIVSIIIYAIVKIFFDKYKFVLGKIKL